MPSVRRLTGHGASAGHHFEANHGDRLSFVHRSPEGCCRCSHLILSETKGAQIEADFGLAQVSVDAKNGHKYEVAELDYTGLELDVDKVTQNVLDVLTQTDAAEAMMQQAKQLSAVTVQNDAQA
ncbi:hypothetical protein LIER_32050 [Lithospermum erythrorhizon]|uniref:Uncharacterized protein n=1 Tax=Lithospermum erythrorhizon TaxID=34254 RepID=A0AAV3RTR7_LITER